MGPGGLHEDIFAHWSDLLGPDRADPSALSTEDAVERCRQLLEQLRAYYLERQGAADEDASSVRLEEQRFLMVRLSEILGPVATLDAEAPEAVDKVHSIQQALKAFFEEIEVYGPLTRTVFERVFQDARQLDRTVHQVQRALIPFGQHLSERLAAGDDASDRLKGDLEDFQRLIDQSAAFLRSLAEDKARREAVEELWARFQEVHAAISIQGRYRPTLQSVDRFQLAPEQEELVAIDYSGALRLQGISGSGKTIILLHRAMRLADENPFVTVRVFTLNRSLAHWLSSTMDAIGGIVPDNLQISALYDFLLEVVGQFQPVDQYRLADDRSGERIESSWHDFFAHEGTDAATNIFADERVKRLTASISGHRNLDVNARDYLRQEMVYIQSAFRRGQRAEYLEARRRSRGIPLKGGQREAALAVMTAWEEWLQVGGLCDIDGLTLDAVEHFVDPVRLDAIREKFPTEHVLVDETQDFSTLELMIVRALVEDPNGPNRFFLAGDLNQKVFPKHHDTVRAGFNFSVGGRGRILRKNFRNTRQVLQAAARISEIYPAQEDRQDLGHLQDPEVSHYEGGLPIVLQCTPDNHVRRVMKIVLMRPRNRIVVLSEDDAFLEAVGRQAEELGIPPYTLLRNEDLDRWREQGDALDARLFVSRLESVKGFEFDTVIACGLSEGVIPAAGSPPEEHWRQAAVVYAALTRARDELIMTYVDRPSPFLRVMEDRVDWLTAPDEDWMKRLLS